jgi:hypothetical protein
VAPLLNIGTPLLPVVMLGNLAASEYYLATRMTQKFDFILRDSSRRIQIGEIGVLHAKKGYVAWF